MQTSCEQCGQFFRTTADRRLLGWGRFCSRRCKGLASRGPRQPGRTNALCEHCGQAFYTKPSRLKIGWGRFCSTRCQSAWQRGRPSPHCKRITKLCEVCQQPFALPPSHASAARYCSRVCWHAARRVPHGTASPYFRSVERTCDGCQQSFFIQPSRLRDGKGRFCSLVCLRQFAAAHRQTHAQRNAYKASWTVKNKALVQQRRKASGAIQRGKRNYYQKNRERIREQSHQHYLAHRDEVIAHMRQWRIRNPERRREQQRQHYAAHRAEYLARTRQANLTRRARLHGASGAHTWEQFWEKCAALDWRCVYCGESVTKQTVHRDHDIPLSRGGSDDLSNIVPACRPCNYRKNAKTGAEFRAYRQRVQAA